MDNYLNANNPITASRLIEYLFCPRIIYYENVLSIPQNEDSRFKVQKGRNIHKRVRKINPDYLRKKLEFKKKSLMYI